MLKPKRSTLFLKLSKKFSDLRHHNYVAQLSNGSTDRRSCRQISNRELRACCPA